MGKILHDAICSMLPYFSGLRHIGPNRMHQQQRVGFKVLDEGSSA